MNGFFVQIGMVSMKKGFRSHFRLNIQAEDKFTLADVERYYKRLYRGFEIRVFQLDFEDFKVDDLSVSVRDKDLGKNNVLLTSSVSINDDEAHGLQLEYSIRSEEVRTIRRRLQDLALEVLTRRSPHMKEIRSVTLTSCTEVEAHFSVVGVLNGAYTIEDKPAII